MLKWNLVRIFKKNFLIGQGAENKKKTKIFTYSIIFGLILSMIVLAIFTKDANPVTEILRGATKIFKNSLSVKQFVSGFVILALAGIAVGVGFKTGLFNIGVSGQMMAGGMTAGLISIKLGDKIPSGIGQILVIVIAVLVGGLTAATAGFLKVKFKIHEVVSTILINWIAFYYMKWMLDPTSSTILDSIGQSSLKIGDNYLLRINGNQMWPLLIILGLTASSMWFMLYKTKFGMRLKMTGLNPDATKYTGVNTKRTAIYSMGISGAIAGLLGAALYFGAADRFTVPGADVIPGEGFNGIAIALIAFSNPALIVPVAIFFGVIKSSIAGTAGAISNNSIDVVLGILMYVTAIGSMFYMLNINKWARTVIKGKEWNAEYEAYKTKLHDMDGTYYEKYSDSKTKEQKEKVIQKHINETQKIKMAFKKDSDKGGK